MPRLRWPIPGKTFKTVVLDVTFHEPQKPHRCFIPWFFETFQRENPHKTHTNHRILKPHTLLSCSIRFREDLPPIKLPNMNTVYDKRNYILVSAKPVMTNPPFSLAVVFPPELSIFPRVTRQSRAHAYLDYHMRNRMVNFVVAYFLCRGIFCLTNCQFILVFPASKRNKQP